MYVCCVSTACVCEFYARVWVHVHVYTSVYIELFEKYSRHYKYTAEKVQLFFLLPNPGTLAFIFASREGKPGSVDGDQ